MFERTVRKILNESDGNNIKLIKITKFEGYEDDDRWDNPGGTVYLKAFGKLGEVIIHPAGEMDFEGFGDLTDEQSNEITNFINSNEEVNKAFPAEDFE